MSRKSRVGLPPRAEGVYSREHPFILPLSEVMGRRERGAWGLVEWDDRNRVHMHLTPWTVTSEASPDDVWREVVRTFNHETMHIAFEAIGEMRASKALDFERNDLLIAELESYFGGSWSDLELSPQTPSA